MKLLKWRNMLFDDYTKADDGHYWSQLNSEEADCYSVPNKLLDECPSEPISGIVGSDKIADYYIDFPNGEVKFVEG